MQKKITPKELSTSVDDVVEKVRLGVTQYVIERDGVPVAAIVPMQVFRAMERARKNLSDNMTKVSRNAHIPDEELERVIEEELRAVRAERRSRGQGGSMQAE